MTAAGPQGNHAFFLNLCGSHFVILISQEEQEKVSFPQQRAWSPGGEGAARPTPQGKGREKGQEAQSKQGQGQKGPETAAEPQSRQAQIPIAIGAWTETRERKVSFRFTRQTINLKFFIRLEELTPEERDARTVFCMQLSQRVRARDLEEFFSSVGKASIYIKNNFFLILLV